MAIIDTRTLEHHASGVVFGMTIDLKECPVCSATFTLPTPIPPATMISVNCRCGEVLNYSNGGELLNKD